MTENGRQLVVGMAAGRKYQNYLHWFLEVPDLKIIKLGHHEGNFESVKECDGLVLCGGEDVHPRYYHKPEYIVKYGLDDIDELRDEFEWKVLSYSQEHKVPLLGICRGLQLANVFFGGTLIPDIPAFDRPDHSKHEEGKDRYHEVKITNKTLLSQVTGIEEGEVNSAHHQGVDALGEGLMVNAVSPDGMIEGLERMKKEGRAYLMLVQWHPERMSQGDSPLSINIRDSFLESIRANKK